MWESGNDIPSRWSFVAVWQWRLDPNRENFPRPQHKASLHPQQIVWQFAFFLPTESTKLLYRSGKICSLKAEKASSSEIINLSRHLGAFLLPPQLTPSCRWELTVMPWNRFSIICLAPMRLLFSPSITASLILIINLNKSSLAEEEFNLLNSLLNVGRQEEGGGNCF